MPEDASLDAFASTDEQAAADSEATDAEAADAGTSGTEVSDVETSDADSEEAEIAESEATDSDASAGDSAVAESPADSAPTVGDADPAVSTYRWSPEGGECADCGASAERRWRADGERDGARVCPDCKEW